MSEPLDHLEEAFAAALACPATERTAFLEQLTLSNPSLAAELSTLLKASETSGDFLEDQPAATFASAGRRALVGEIREGATEEMPGARIGRYRLVEKLGEGGCGVVYLADQEEPVQRRVALKIIKLGMDTRAVVARFEAERQALALMDHPHIARVFDAGETQRGRPFFVMELVEGVPITRFCDEQRLALAPRLELFIKVCHAIQHAHQKGVIHRDIKPSNVLVARQDGEAVPKIIDFGIAKATETRLTAHTLVTEFAQIVGTPAYMSPEQMDFVRADIDTRSDVYALGVLLYELLAGRTPFATTDLLRGGFDEMRRQICDVEPARPSVAVAALSGEVRATVASGRNLEPGRVTGQLRGELDWIVMRCLEKDRARRYATASALAEDVRRHLNNETVTAAAPGGLYALKKFARRHRAAFAAGIAFASLLIAAVGVSGWLAARATQAERLAQERLRTEQAARAGAERERARAIAAEKQAKDEAARATAINDFLQNDILIQANPSRQSDRNLTVRDAVDAAARRIDWKFVGQPLVELTLRETLGRTYLTLGEYVSAESQVDRAIQLAQGQVGAEHARTINLQATRTDLLRLQGRLREAETLARELLAVQTRLRGANSEEAMNMRHQVAALLLDLGRPDEAEPLMLAVVAAHQRDRGAEDGVTLNARNTLGNIWFELGRIEEAENLHRELLAIRVRFAGAESLDATYSMSGLATVLRWKGEFGEAADLQRNVVTIRGKVLGQEHPDTLSALHNLAFTLSEEGRPAAALEPATRVWEARRRVLGAVHPVTVVTAHTVAVIYRRLNRLDEAETLLTSTLESAREVLGPTHRSTLNIGGALGEVWLARGKFSEAEALLRENAMRREKMTLDVWHRFSERGMLGAAVAAIGRPADAERLLLEGWEGLRQHESELSAVARRRLPEIAAQLARLYDGWGRPDEAAKWRR